MSQTDEQHASRAGEGRRLRRLDVVLHAFAAVFFLVTALLVAFDGGALTAAAGTAAWLIVLAALVLASRGPRVVVMGLLVASVTLVGVTTEGSPQSVGPPMYALGALGYGAAVLFTTRAVVALVLAGGPAYIALRCTVQSGMTLPRAIDEFAMVGATAVVGSLLFSILRRVSADSDDTERARLELEIGTAIVRAERERRRQLHHLLHDDVIAALRMIADFSQQANDHLRDMCRRTAAAIGEARVQSAATGGGVAEVLAAAAGQTSLRTHPIPAPPEADLTPIALVDAGRVAVTRAVNEALRNVERHTDVDSVGLGWWSTSTHHVIRIADAGPGINDAAPGWGRQHAIEASMRDIRGDVEVTSRAGAGSVVDLRWPVEPTPRQSALEQTHQDTLQALGDGRVVKLVAVTVLIPHVYFGLRYTGVDALTPYEAVYGAVLLGIILWSATRLSRSQLPRSAPVVLALVVAVGSGGLSMINPQSFLTFESWYLGLSSLALTLPAFFAPVRWLVIMLGPVALCLVAATYLDPAMNAMAASGAITACLLPPVFGFALGAVLRANGRELTDQTRQLATLTQRVQDTRLRTVGRWQPPDFVGDRVARLLVRVADGDLDPSTSRAVRREAHLLSLEVRDELMLPGVLDDRLRARITEARARGTSVELTRSEEVGGPPGPLLRLLDRVLDHGDALEALVVRLPAGHDAGEIAVLPGLEAQRLELVLPDTRDAEVRHDDFSLVIRLL